MINTFRLHTYSNQWIIIYPQVARLLLREGRGYGTFSDSRGYLHNVNLISQETWPSATGTREPGGGAVGATCPSTWNLWEHRPPPPPLWTVDVVHLYFCLFLHVNLGPSKKIVGEIRRVSILLSRGYLGPRETFAPPPPSSK